MGLFKINKSSKRGCALLLAAVLLITGFASACGKGTAGPAAKPTPAPPSEPTSAPSPETDITVSLASAFSEESLSGGSLSPDEIGFYIPNGENPRIEVLPREEVLAWHEGKPLPRTSFFDGSLTENSKALCPYLDYAYVHSFSRVCIPTVCAGSFDCYTVSKDLSLIYHINNARVDVSPSAVFDLDGGQKLQFITVVFNGMELCGRADDYPQAMAAAEAIVAGIPEGSGEYDKALYIYRWLTENVRFDGGDYYSGDWDLLYDALIKKQTVCAGFSEVTEVLFSLVGIECITVGGSLFVNDAWGSHVWNAAKIDGEFYLFDATLDAGLPPSQYRFFGVSTETMNSVCPRMLLGGPEKYCPPCTHDLKRPE